MADFAKVTAILGLDASQFKREFSEVDDLLGGWPSRLAKLATSATGTFTAITLAVGALKDMTVKAGAAAEQIGNLAQASGISTTFLQGLQFSLEQAGIGSDAAVTSMRILSRQMEQAQDSTSETAYKFAELGIIITEQSTSEEVLAQIAQAFSQMEDGAKKTAMATEFFGRAGSQLIPILNKGAAGLDEMAGAAKRFGVALDPEALKALKAVDDATDKLNATSQGLVNTWTIKLAPAVTAWQNLKATVVEFSNFLSREMIASATKMVAYIAGSGRLIGAHLAAGLAIGEEAVRRTSAELMAAKKAITDDINATIALTEAEKHGAEVTANTVVPAKKKLVDMLANARRESAEINFQWEMNNRVLAESARRTNLWISLEQQVIQEVDTLTSSTDQFNAEMAQRQQVTQAVIASNAELAQRSAANAIADEQAALAADKAKADSGFALAQARYQADQSIFKSNEAVRAARLAQIDADAAYQVEKSTGTEAALLAIQQTAQAQRIAVAQQFPTFMDQQFKHMQDAATQAFANIQSAFANSVANMIVHGGTFTAFMQQMAVTILSTMVQLATQMLVKWVATQIGMQTLQETTDAARLSSHTIAETGRSAATIAANKVIVASTVISTIAAGQVTLGAMMAVVTAAAAILYAAATAAATVPFGQPIAGALIVAATTMGLAGAAALIAGGAALAGVATAAAATLAVPAAAEGGIVTGPTLLMAGEAGPEAIVPLDGNHGFGGEQHIHVYLDGRAILNTVVRGLPRQLRINGIPAI